MDEKAVLEHLLFHKALGEEMDYYIDLCKKVSEGYAEIKDDYERSIATLFSLAMEEKIDPWNIDIAAFSKEYLRRLKKEGMNIVYAGRLILLAWEVLRAQSERAVEAFTPQPEIEEFYEPAEIDSYGIEPRPTRALKSPVSVFDLVKALESVKRLERARIGKKKEKGRAKPNIDGMIHAEEIKSQEVYEFVREDGIDDGDMVFAKFGLVEGMAALLYLARDKRVEIWQENFPFGKIWIKA
jgi:segregation and condensation protein A